MKVQGGEGQGVGADKSIFTLRIRYRGYSGREIEIVWKNMQNVMGPVSLAPAAASRLASLWSGE